MAKSFVREKRIEAGRFLDVKIYLRSWKQEMQCKEKRARKMKMTEPPQKAGNDKARKKYGKLLLYTNFGTGDYYGTCTFMPGRLPKNPEDGERIQGNILKKLKRLYQRKGIELKYMIFTEYDYSEKDGFKEKRFHFHIVMNQGVDRDEVEACFSEGRGKKAKPYGRMEVQRITPDGDGSNETLFNYLTRQKKNVNGKWVKGVKRWSRSQNLTKPTITTNDSAWSQRKLEKMGKSTDVGEELIKKRFPGYRIVELPEAKYFEDSGWHVHAKLIKYENERESSG